MGKPENKIGVNRPSPKSEPKYVNAYKQIVDVKSDKDVSAVNVDGTPGYGQLPLKFNRSRDDKPHRIESFISSEDLRKSMKK